MKKLVAAIDIGGTNTKFGLVTEAGKIISEDSVLTKNFSDPRELVKEVSDRIFKMLPAGSELSGAGIGAPNGNFYTGTIDFAPNLAWKGSIPLAKYFSEVLNCKALLTNDAKAAALGEMIFGGAKKMKDFLFITLGTGLGSGIVANGNLVYGHDSLAGEVGHVIMFQDGRQCGCGRKGCLETYCSATGLKRTYAELNPQAGTVDSKYIFDKANAGDKVALEAFRRTGDVLGLALANSVAYTRPEAIFLFGGLVGSGDLIFKPTIESFERNLLNIYKNKIKILPSQLPDNDAAILGAASLILNDHN
ncbi:MAG TPA: ROK family protein [Bacteroidia bacterium]|jgi:glucokinase